MDAPDLFLETLLGRAIVVDTAPPFVILGKLVRYDAQHLLIEQADVHDLRDSSTNRENYVRDCRRHGVRANRRSVLITRREVVGISPLDDVLV